MIDRTRLSACDCLQGVRSYENKAAGVFVSGFDPSSAVSQRLLMLSACDCLQGVRSYENKAAGVFVSGFDPLSAVSQRLLLKSLFVCVVLVVLRAVTLPS